MKRHALVHRLVTVPLLPLTMTFRILSLATLTLVVLLQAGCASDGSLQQPNTVSDDGNGWGAGFKMQ